MSYAPTLILAGLLVAALVLHRAIDRADFGRRRRRRRHHPR